VSAIILLNHRDLDFGWAQLAKRIHSHLFTPADLKGKAA
jgi:hypothetical protein